MFAEKDIYGVWDCTVDNKGRFGIPARTGAEEGEEFAVILKKDYYEITLLENVKKHIEKIQMEYKYSNKLQEALENFYVTILCTATLDSQARIITGKSIPSGKYKIVGARKSIYLMPQNIYEEKMKKQLLM